MHRRPASFLTTPRGATAATLSRWRWRILVGGLLLTILFEIIEPWLAPVAAGLEIILFGLVVPAGTWLALTLLARELTRQAELEQRLGQLRDFVHQLAQHYSQGQLITFVTRYPATLLPVERTTLYLYDHRQARYDFIEAHPAALNGAADPGMCAQCPMRDSGLSRELHACPVAGSSAANYCLPLTHEQLVLGRLHVTCAADARLTPAQVEFLNAVAPEMALALLMATVHSEEMTVARSEGRREERRQLSLTLHNSLAQQMGYLHLSLDRLAESVPQTRPDGLSQELGHLRDVAGEAYQQVRGLLADLRAPNTHDLARVIDGRLRAFTRASGIPAHLRVCGHPQRLPVETSQQVFSLVHEGLNNVQKHAGAKAVTLHLEWGDTALVVRVSDDGRGFDLGALPANGHYGLQMLREVTADLGGQMHLTSAVGAGTQLEFRLPLPARQTPACSESPSWHSAD